MDVFLDNPKPPGRRKPGAVEVRTTRVELTVERTVERELLSVVSTQHVQPGSSSLENSGLEPAALPLFHRLAKTIHALRRKNEV